MNYVIEQLSQIEEAAGKIMENTTTQKMQMAQDSKEKIAAYDEEVQQFLNAEIAAMKAENDGKLQKEIQQIRESCTKDILNMEQEYKENHVKLAQGIVDILTGV